MVWIVATQRRFDPAIPVTVRLRPPLVVSAEMAIAVARRDASASRVCWVWSTTTVFAAAVPCLISTEYSATSPTVFWIPLDQLDFQSGAAVKRLPLKSGETYNGDASEGLVAAEAFKFLEAKP